MTNTGSRAGAEIVQLYVAKPDAKIFRPAQELKGFAKVQLAAGESKTVTIPLDDKAFRYWNAQDRSTGRWKGGSYELLRRCLQCGHPPDRRGDGGGHRRPGPLCRARPCPTTRTGRGGTACRTPSTRPCWAVPMPEGKVRIDRNMTLGELGHGRSPLGWIDLRCAGCAC